MTPSPNSDGAPASPGGEPVSRRGWTKARRRFAAAVWGALGEPGIADWAAYGPEVRERMSRRAVAVGVAGIVGTNAMIGIETSVLVQLAYSGGRLTVESTIAAPNFPGVVVAILVGIVGNVVLGLAMLRPQIQWFVSGVPADCARRAAIARIPYLQVASTVIAWAAAVLSYILVAANSLTVTTVVGVIGAFTLAGASSACLTYLFAERAARPLMMVALAADPVAEVVQGVHTRMLSVWAVSSGVPMVGLLAVNLGRHLGLLPPVAGAVDWASVLLAVVALVAGGRIVVLVGQSLIDPLTELRDAVEKVHAGDLSAHVDVYDTSELGVLQQGFNEMVAGLDERERMRELFARHVGDTVAELAIANGMGLHGTNAEVGVLFVDIVGSTTIAQQRRPEETAALLNGFFEIVAQVVDKHAGFVNKFEGDAALAVFGAPVAIGDPAGAALAAARELGQRLRDDLDIRWGIGVSSGVAFAGNIGAERRYEYTVIGDPVNECARLSELAKSAQVPVLGSGVAVRSACDEESVHWTLLDRRVVRGRSTETEIFGPVELIRDRPMSVGEFVATWLRPSAWLGTSGP
ncbi:MAG: adenylate/guanylate cyclase domain-containing protein [Gordonia sp. (in: high G+C Gram-positive bacteria)]